MYELLAIARLNVKTNFHQVCCGVTESILVVVVVTISARLKLVFGEKASRFTSRCWCEWDWLAAILLSSLFESKEPDQPLSSTSYGTASIHPHHTSCTSFNTTTPTSFESYTCTHSEREKRVELWSHLRMTDAHRHQL